MEFESKEKEQKVMDIVNKEINENPKLAELRLMLKAGFLKFSPSYVYRDYPSIDIINSEFSDDYRGTTILTFLDNPDYEIYEDEDYFKITSEVPGRNYDCKGEYDEDGEFHEFSQYEYDGECDHYRDFELEESLLWAQRFAVDKVIDYKIDLMEIVAKYNAQKEKDKIEGELDITEEKAPTRRRRM